MSVTILLGDVMDRLREMPADHVDTVVTSPPYWGLRDYGIAGQLGLERTLAEHLAAMVAVFAEVRRVLKPTGTLWLNYGDCYATSPNGRSAADTKRLGGDDRTFRDKPFSTVQGLLKPKDLCMVPNRLAIALQEDGWWVRSEIIWAKPNPMPESVHDRPATSHEKVFLLSKAPRYFYDAEAGRQGLKPSSLSRLAQNVEALRGSDRARAGGKTNGRMKAVGGRMKVRASDLACPRHAGGVNHTGIEATPRGEGRNLRNFEPAPVQVWPIATRPFSEAHFATFPPELVERCLKVGCPPGGHVLDPFGGAGTTAVVADAMGFDCTLIEINPDYAAIAERRIAAQRQSPLQRMAAKSAGEAGGLFAWASAPSVSEERCA
jgi:DNA modification methylase